MNTTRIAAIGVIALSLAAAPPVRAQYTANYQTNIISGVTSNWPGDYLIAYTNFADVLLIQNSGVLSNGYGYLGYEVSSSNNSVLVTGSGSAWSNRYDLSVGYNGASNTLVISDGARVVNGYGYAGYNSSSSNNSVLVTGVSSAWRNRYDLSVGYNGASNTLVISGGARVASHYGYAGYNSSSSNNSVLVTGTGSVWTNEREFYIGYSGAGNSLVISNGGRVVDSSDDSLAGCVGYNFSSSNNSVLVIGTNSVWENWGAMFVGAYGAGNRLVVSAGGQISCDDGRVSSGSNSVLVTGSGSVWSNGDQLEVYGMRNSLVINDDGQVVSGDVTIGNSYNSLVISNGALVVSGASVVGVNSHSSNNCVLVTGPDSVWTNGGDLTFGEDYYASSNSLVISDGGKLLDNDALVEGTNNSVLVTDPYSLWNNSGSIDIGSGRDCSLVISNGGQVFDVDGAIGDTDDTWKNKVLVTGAGSVWGNSSNLWVGLEGVRNSLLIISSGTVYSSYGYVGCSNSAIGNSVLVTDPGSAWINHNDLYVGFFGSSNQLTVTDNSSVVASSAYVGYYLSSVNNRITLAGGSLTVTNALGNGVLDVRRGTLTINSGMVMVDALIVTNGADSIVIFNGGVLKSRSTAVSNSAVFMVGNGVDAAEFDLLGGVHSFANGLEVRNNAVLSGCGTISGSVLVDPNALVLADCGGTLTFTGAVTNNGTMRAVTNTTLEFYGPVVNNGLIDVIDGYIVFHDIFIDNGAIVDASYFRVVDITRQTDDINITWTTVGGDNYVVQVTSGTADGSYSNNFIDLSPTILVPGSTLGTTNYLDVGGATNFPSRFYRVRLSSPTPIDP